jgi:cytochrome c oxidase subunit II
MPLSKLRLPRLPSGFRLAALLALVVLCLLAVGCIGDTDTPQNTLAPEGEVARKQRDLFMWAMWPALVVMVLVLGGIVVMVLRFRRREGDAVPKQTHGNMPLEIAWTIVPTLIIIGFVGIPMIPALWDLGREPSDDAYPIKVIGQRFQWSFEYPQILDDQGNPVESEAVVPGQPAELHIPAGREIALTITSVDVNHSFGVPRLAGTRDAVKGQEERMWIKADHPGSFAGQCRELCGTGHAGMLITVIALSEEDFEDWSREMAAGTKGAPDGEAEGAVVASGSEE